MRKKIQAKGLSVREADFSNKEANQSPVRGLKAGSIMKKAPPLAVPASLTRSSVTQKSSQMMGSTMTSFPNTSSQSMVSGVLMNQLAEQTAQLSVEQRLTHEVEAFSAWMEQHQRVIESQNQLLFNMLSHRVASTISFGAKAS